MSRGSNQLANSQGATNNTPDPGCELIGEANFIDQLGNVALPLDGPDQQAREAVGARRTPMGRAALRETISHKHEAPVTGDLE